MDVNIRGRNVNITARFEDYVGAKIEKLSALLPKTQAFEARVSRTSDKSPENGDRVELTLIGPGPTIRAEAYGNDKFSAFDIAYGRLLERVRRHKDKRKANHRRGKTSLAEAAANDFANLDITPADSQVLDGTDSAAAAEENYSPVVIRHKAFDAETLTASEAVDRMELVGHDFFLFIDAQNDQPSVVYRRKGWNYGVITLN